MRKFSCDEARAHLSDALLAEIGRPEANVLEAHLLDCDPCRSLSELFLWQDRVITELAAQARLDTLMSKIREGIQNQSQVTFEEELQQRRRQWSWTFPTKGVAAAAAFILALIAVLYWRPTIPDPVAMLAPTPPPRPVEVQPEPPVRPVESVKPPEDPIPAPPIENPVQPPPVVAVDPPKATPDVATAPKVPAPVAPPKDPAPVRTRPPDVVAKVPVERKDVVLRPKTLDDAVRGGMAFLREQAARFVKDRETNAEELLLWTFIHGGVAEADPEFQGLLKSILTKPLERTYNVAIMAMVLEELDRVKYQNRIAQCAQFLVDNQCPNGQWSYGNPSIFVQDINLPPVPAKQKGLRKVPITRKRDGQGAGDNSNSHYAMLGLRACHDAGILLPRAVVEQASKWWRDSQSRTATVKGAPSAGGDGWCYGKHDHKPYGSMTVGGIGSLIICDYILGTDWKKDPQVASGMDWLAKNFSVAYNPGPYEHGNMEENSQHQVYYYLYGLERAATLYGTEQIGGHFWFAKGLQALIDAQKPDGSWRGGTGELKDTCFAILFLRKATRALVDVPTPGAGTPKK